MQTLPDNRQKELGSAPLPTRSARRALAAAFASFNQAAGTLEATYTNLQVEVGGLRRELEERNRRLQESLEENERMRGYLAGIVAGLPCGVLVLNRENQAQLINPAARQLLNPSGDDASARLSLIQESIDALVFTLAHRDSGSEFEWVLEGSQRTLGITRASLEASDAGAGSVFILRDLTESKQLEREREIARRSQALAEVATLLAHEVRNPLGSLELFAGLLADALEDQPELRLWIGHVQAGLRTLAATVNNVLQFHGEPSAPRVTVDLQRLIEETVDFLAPLVRQKEMHLAWLASTARGLIQADPPRLQQAFFNLALNALRAMEPGGTLSIHLREGASCHTLAIDFEDQGSGIAEENLGKIFDPGFSTQGGSPGLGLAVVQKVVDQHGGQLSVKSLVGHGSTFTLLLPSGDMAEEEAELHPSIERICG